MALISDIKNESTMKTVEENDIFYMYTYKIVTCPRKYSHDWTSCPYAHSGESARRREPSLYKPIPCPESKGGAPCPRGDSCKYAHNDFEYWLHPGRYKTEYCKQGPGCSRKICFFAHRPDDIRKTPSVVYTNQGPFLTSIKSNANNMVSNEQAATTAPASPPATTPTKLGGSSSNNTSFCNDNSQSFNTSISNNTSTVAAGFSSQHQKRLSLDTYDSINLNNDFMNALRFPSIDSNISNGNLGATTTTTSTSNASNTSNTSSISNTDQQNQFNCSNAVSLNETSVSLTGEAFKAFKTPMMPSATAPNANLMVHTSTSTGAFENADLSNMSLAAILATTQQSASTLRDINTSNVNVNSNVNVANSAVSTNNTNAMKNASSSSPTSALMTSFDPAFNFDTCSQVQQALNLVATYGTPMPLNQDPGFLQRSDLNITDSIWSPNRSNFDLFRSSGIQGCNNNNANTKNEYINYTDTDLVNQLHQGLQVQIDQYKLLQQNLQMLKCNNLAPANNNNAALSDTYHQTRRSSISDNSDASPSYFNAQNCQQNINTLPLFMNDIVSFPSSSSSSSSTCSVNPVSSTTNTSTSTATTPHMMSNINNILFNGLKMPASETKYYGNIHRRSLSDMPNGYGLSTLNPNAPFELSYSGIVDSLNMSQQQQQQVTSFPSDNFNETIYNNIVKQ